MLEYKGFRGRVDIDNGEDAFTGEVDGIRDVVTFEGRTPVEVKIAFRASVEDYLAMGGAAPVPPAAPAVPLKPVHWRRWAVIGPDGDCRRLCLTDGDAWETACGDEEVQEVAVYPVDAPAPAVRTRWEDDDTVKAARRAALQAIVDGLWAVGVAASVVGDGSTALDALCRAVAACGTPDAEPLPDVRAEDVAEIDAMIAKLESSIRYRDEESKTEVLPEFHGKMFGRRVDVEEDKQYGERHRTIKEIEQKRLDALRAALAVLEAVQARNGGGNG